MSRGVEGCGLQPPSPEGLRSTAIPGLRGTKQGRHPAAKRRGELGEGGEVVGQAAPRLSACRRSAGPGRGVGGEVGSPEAGRDGGRASLLSRRLSQGNGCTLEAGLLNYV